MAVLPRVSYSRTVRLQITSRPGMLGRVASCIIPSVFNTQVAPAVAGKVARAAHATGVARRRRRRRDLTSAR